MCSCSDLWVAWKPAAHCVGTILAVCIKKLSWFCVDLYVYYAENTISGDWIFLGLSVFFLQVMLVYTVVVECRTWLIIFPVVLQTVITAQMLSVRGERGCSLLNELALSPRVWRRGAVSRVSDSRSRGRGFESRLGTRRKNSGQVFHTYVPLSSSIISWYRPKGSDALWLGSKGRYGSYVGGR